MRIPRFGFGMKAHEQAMGIGRETDFPKKGARPRKPNSAPQVIEQSFAITQPPGLAAASSVLMGLGFDQASSSKNRLLAKKIESRSLLGAPYLFIELEIRGGTLFLRYSVPDEGATEQRRLKACILLLRVLSIFPGAKIDAAGASLALLPALESSILASDEDYASIFSKLRRAQTSQDEIAERNRKLLRVCEEEAALSIERERQINALSKRVAKLEAVSDKALEELILEWLDSHQGSFSPTTFSHQHQIPPSRAEEGLEMLLKSGAVRKVGNGFQNQKSTPAQVFEVNASRIHRVVFQTADSIGRLVAKER